MTKKMEKLLFKTIKEAIEFGYMDRYGFSNFDFTKLYKAIERLEKKK